MEDIRAKLMREMTHTQSFPDMTPEDAAYFASKESPTRGVPLEQPPISPEDLIGPGLLKLGAKGLRSAATLIRRPADVYSQARREFLRGKAQGAEQAAPEIATTIAAPVAEAAAQTVPRRDFLKGAAALGGAGAAGVLVPKSLTTLAKVLEPAVAKDAGLLGAKVAAKAFNPAAILGHSANWIKTHADDFASGGEWTVGSHEMEMALNRVSKDPEMVKLLEAAHAQYGEEGARNLLHHGITMMDDPAMKTGSHMSKLNEAYNKKAQAGGWNKEMNDAWYKETSKLEDAASNWVRSSDKNGALAEQHLATGKVPPGMPKEYAGALRLEDLPEHSHVTKISNHYHSALADIDETETAARYADEARRQAKVLARLSKEEQAKYESYDHFKSIDTPEWKKEREFRKRIDDMIDAEP